MACLVRPERPLIGALWPTNRDGLVSMGVAQGRMLPLLTHGASGPPHRTLTGDHDDRSNRGGGMIRRGRRSPVFAAWLAISRGPVCERWRSFSNFYADVGKRPTWRHLVMREDTSRPFEPGNAQWRVGPTYRRRRKLDASKQNCAA